MLYVEGDLFQSTGVVTTSNMASSSIVYWTACQSCGGRGAHVVLQGPSIVPVVCTDCGGAGGFGPYVIGSIRNPPEEIIP